MRKTITALCFSWQAVFIITFAIVFFSLIPVDGKYQPGIIFFDKIAHAFSYALLSLVTVNTLTRRAIKKPRRLSFLYSFFLGFSIEIIQAYIPYRDFEAADIVVNAFGGLAGCLFRFI